MTRPASPWSAATRVALIFLPLGTIGTVTHELGHAAGAWIGGLECRIHHAWVSLPVPPAEGSGAHVAFLLGGPLQTMLTGTVGFCWLAARRHRAGRAAPIGVTDWIATGLALFWSRQVVVLLEELASLFLGLPGLGDENELSILGGWPPWTLPLGLGAAGIAACLVVLRLHPPGSAWILVLAGGAGSLTGAALWLLGLGPVVLP